MAIIIVSHDVKDFATWKPHYDEDVPRRENAGLQEIAVGTQADNPNKVFMIWEGDPEVFDRMLQDQELGLKMQEAGVVSKPEVVVVNIS